MRALVFVRKFSECEDNQKEGWKSSFCICQGCRRFLTISDPRWDQPISDIFI